MNSNEMLQSTATTAITVAQLLENSQLQVLTHEYLYTSVIMQAEYNLDLILLPVQWIKSTWYKKRSFKRHLGKKKFFPIPQKNGMGERDHKTKT